jgi:hypothetical protein
MAKDCVTGSRFVLFQRWFDQHDVEPRPEKVMVQLEI